MANVILAAAVRGAPIIFSGTVRQLGAGSFSGLPPSERLAVVRVSRTFRAAPVLGTINDHEITVLLDPRSEVQVGYEGVFFATSWVYGESIAVREIEHYDDSQSLESEVTEIVHQIPDLELIERIRTSDIVAQVIVGEPRKAGIKERIEWDAPDWALSPLYVENILAGPRDRTQLNLVFPRARTGRFARSPKFYGDEHVILLLRPFSESDEEQESVLAAWTALDPRDVIDPARIDFVIAALAPEVKL